MVILYVGKKNDKCLLFYIHTFRAETVGDPELKKLRFTIYYSDVARLKNSAKILLSGHGTLNCLNITLISLQNMRINYEIIRLHVG